MARLVPAALAALLMAGCGSGDDKQANTAAAPTPTAPAATTPAQTTPAPARTSSTSAAKAPAVKAPSAIGGAAPVVPARFAARIRARCRAAAAGSPGPAPAGGPAVRAYARKALPVTRRMLDALALPGAPRSTRIAIQPLRNGYRALRSLQTSLLSERTSPVLRAQLARSQRQVAALAVAARVPDCAPPTR